MRAKLAAMAGPIKALDDAGVFFARTSSTFDVSEVIDELNQLSATLGMTTAAVTEDADALRDEAEAAALARRGAQANRAVCEDAPRHWRHRPHADELVTLNRELRALKATSDLDAEAIRRFGVSLQIA